MAGIYRKGSRVAGLPPGALVHIGDRKSEKVEITVFGYNESGVEEREVDRVEECLELRDNHTATWINVDGLHCIDVLEKLGQHFGIHHLVLEDILDTDQRPKIEDYGDYLYMVLKMFYYDETGSEIITEQVSIVLGSNYVISFQERPGDVFDPVRERIRTGKVRIRKLGADYLAYALVDSIVDNYFVVLEKLYDRIESLEEELVVNPSGSTLKTIHSLKNEMLFLRRSVWPLREVVGRMERLDTVLIRETTAIYLRDLYDHIIQTIDTLETFREMLSGMIDIYLSSISNRMNEVMKVLTIIATIFIPLSFVAGVYGMNFDYMPELSWRWGYYAVLLLMAGAGIFMVMYFKRKK
ncbi:MAG: magnesium/cobalt transporter CorA, partial [Syntrophaceae bacterium]|nr:magnesium/cobalt transporter CorA [Syntrophaceae bacterium]